MTRPLNVSVGHCGIHVPHEAHRWAAQMALAGWYQDCPGTSQWPRPPTESYTVEQIREAFARWASDDSWGVKAHYVNTLLSALRGEFDRDKAERSASVGGPLDA